MLVKPRDIDRQIVFYNKVPKVTLGQVQKSKNIILQAFSLNNSKPHTIEIFKDDGIWFGRQLSPMHDRVSAPIARSDEQVHKTINIYLSGWWGKIFDDVYKVIINIADTTYMFVKNEKVAPRWKQHSGSVPDYIHLGYKEPFGKNRKTKVPSKLESKGMKQHSKVNKSNSLTKSYKKMTGDIEALGENFNKLI